MAAQMIRLLIASSVRVHAEALAASLARKQRLHVIGAATTPGELLLHLRKNPPDVVLLDGSTASIVSTPAELRKLAQTTKVVAITPSDREDDVLQVAEAGVAGYVLPDGSLEDVIVALESAVRGELRVSPQVAYRLLRRLGAVAHAIPDKDAGPAADLTTREREILELVDRRLSNKEIARELKIEVGTAKNHVHNILKKLHVHRRIDASTWFRKAGFHLRLET
jgi:DNA-binding NarL/FixJ family response regulator